MENMGLKQLVLVPAPFQGHLNPMLQLGQILYSKGFSITIAHFQLNPPDPSHHPNFHFLEIPFDFSAQQISITGLLALVLKLNISCQSIFLSCLDELMKQQKRNCEISCIIYDELMYFSGVAANHLRLPCAILRTASAAAFFSRITLFELIDEGCIPFPDSILEDMVPGLHPLRFKDLPLTMTGTLEAYSRLLAETKKTRNALANIFNTTSFLEEHLLKRFKQEFQIQVFPIGPMHKFATNSSSGELKEDSTCIEWLNKQARNSVLYVSMGSIASTDEHELNEMAWGLANSKQAFLWVIRTGSVEGSEWIESLSQRFFEVIRGRGHLTKWAPQRKVLAHEAVGGFWTHCGWNSTLESISEGVPMICKPCFGDQKVNARYISHEWKVGFELADKVNREDIEKAIKKLMASSEGDELRLRASNLEKMVEVGVAEGGSSYNSLNCFVEKLQDLI